MTAGNQSFAGGAPDATLLCGRRLSQGVLRAPKSLLSRPRAPRRLRNQRRRGAVLGRELDATKRTNYKVHGDFERQRIRTERAGRRS